MWLCPRYERECKEGLVADPDDAQDKPKMKKISQKETNSSHEIERALDSVRPRSAVASRKKRGAYEMEEEPESDMVSARARRHHSTRVCIGGRR